MKGRRTLLFISPRFLFPVDSGGKIRTTQILRGLKGGRFTIRLASPGSADLAAQYRTELASVCDEYLFWKLPSTSWRRSIDRARFLLGPLPMPIRMDWSRDASRIVTDALAQDPDVVVFDFLHAAVLAPKRLAHPTVLFTHNVEAEIFLRHSQVDGNALLRGLWRSQHRKMLRFEAQNIGRFDVTVAVSERDRRLFETDYGAGRVVVIPTGVDLDFFQSHPITRRDEIVFCGSMDWLANQDAVRYFMDDVWPSIARRLPRARVTIVGRSPPASMVEDARVRGLPWNFTGFVDDVRPFVAGAAVSIIPMRIAGGTRLKVYESMAMGAPLVSTSIGVEGLPVQSGMHCEIADDSAGFADAVVALMQDQERAEALSKRARGFVEEHCGFKVASSVFEQACLTAMECAASRSP